MRIYGLLSVLPDSPYGEGHGGSWADVADRHSGHCTREAGNFFPVAVYRVRVWGISVRDIPEAVTDNGPSGNVACPSAGYGVGSATSGPPPLMVSVMAFI